MHSVPFHPLVQQWFFNTFADATEVQREGWREISSAADTLIAAPTGSGKTLTAFLWALNGLVEAALSARLEDRTQILYVSPLKALGNDIHKNLQVPLSGIRQLAEKAGTSLAEIRVAVRSGEPLYARQLKQAGIDRTFGDGDRPASEVQAEQAHSGAEEFTGQMRWVYQELRDRKVAMFIDHLPEGVWEMRYDLRAETPGRFHALPVLGYAMYVPEIRANSQELRLSVTE